MFDSEDYAVGEEEESGGEAEGEDPVVELVLKELASRSAGVAGDWAADGIGAEAEAGAGAGGGAEVGSVGRRSAGEGEGGGGVAEVMWRLVFGGGEWEGRGGRLEGRTNDIEGAEG